MRRILRALKSPSCQTKWALQMPTSQSVYLREFVLRGFNNVTRRCLHDTPTDGEPPLGVVLTAVYCMFRPRAGCKEGFEPHGVVPVLDEGNNSSPARTRRWSVQKATGVFAGDRRDHVS